MSSVSVWYINQRSTERARQRIGARQLSLPIVSPESIAACERCNASDAEPLDANDASELATARVLPGQLSLFAPLELDASGRVVAAWHAASVVSHPEGSNDA